MIKRNALFPDDHAVTSRDELLRDILPPRDSETPLLLDARGRRVGPTDERWCVPVNGCLAASPSSSIDVGLVRIAWV